MSKQLFSYLVLAAALLATIAQAVIYYPQMPVDVASHFGANGAANGAANGWMSKTAFVAMMVGLQFGMAAFLIGIGFLMSKLPTSMINIPNREYWLADERRQATLADNQTMLVWIAALTAVFLVFVFQLTINANLQQAQGINMVLFGVALVGYLLAIMLMVLRLYSKYGKVPE